MERVTIVIETGTSAFEQEPATEIADILERIAAQVRDGQDVIKVLDCNDIEVGSFSIRRVRA